MKTVSVVFRLLILMVLLSHCSLREWETKTCKQEPSGSLVIYTSMYQNVIEAIQQKLAAKFPRLHIEFCYENSVVFQEHIAAELQTGKLGCDMIIIAEPSYAFELKKQGVLHPYRSKYMQSIAHPYDHDGYWYPVRVSNMVLAYDSSKTPETAIAHSFQEFSEKDDLYGCISMPNPSISGTAFAAMLGLYDAYGETFFTNLEKQRVILESSASAIDKLEHGEYRQIMVLEENILKRRQAGEASLEVVYPEDGTVMIPSPIMTIAADKSAHRNIKACEAVTDWFLSEEGQHTIVDCWMHSISKHPCSYPFDAHASSEIRDNILPIDWTQGYMRRDIINKLFANVASR